MEVPPERRRAGRAAARTTAAAAGYRPISSLERAQRLVARELDLAQRVAIGPDVARGRRTRLRRCRRRCASALRPAAPVPRRREWRRAPSRPAAPLRWRGTSSSRPAPRSTGARTRSRRDGGGVGRGRRAAVAHAAPEVELPVTRSAPRPVRPRAVARHLAAAASEQIDRRIQLRAGELGVEQRLLDARRGDPQVGVVRDRLGDGGRQAARRETSRASRRRRSRRRRRPRSRRQAAPSPAAPAP